MQMTITLHNYSKKGTWDTLQDRFIIWQGVL